jgi:hypothetical protein
MLAKALAEIVTEDEIEIRSRASAALDGKALDLCAELVGGDATSFMWLVRLCKDYFIRPLKLTERQFRLCVKCHRTFEFKKYERRCHECSIEQDRLNELNRLRCLRKKSCVICGKKFEAHHNRKTCGDKCAKQRQSDVSSSRWPGIKLEEQFGIHEIMFDAMLIEIAFDKFTQEERTSS